jgi:tight adherence protein C
VSGGLAPVLAGAAAVLGVTGLASLLPPRFGVRARRPRPERRGALVVGVLARAGTVLHPAAGRRAPQDLAARLAAAGVPANLGLRELMAAKLAAAVTGGLAGVLLGALLPGRLGLLTTVVGPAAGFLAPDLWLGRRARERARHVRRELPSLLDLLRVSVEAGGSLAAGLGAVGARAPGPLGEEWRSVGRQVELGVPLAEALDRLRRRLPLAEVLAFVAALERAARHGTPLADTLAAQARDARLARRRRIQEEAAKAGPKIQLVVALLLVPSVLLMVAAALVSALIDGGGVRLA